MEPTIKVLMLHRIFASYRKPIYDKLAEKYNYVLLQSDKDATINQSTTYYSKKIRAFQYSKNETHLIFDSFSYLIQYRPQVFIHEFAIGILTLLPTYILCKLMGIKFILYSHGYDRQTGFHPDKNWTDKYRSFLYKIADATVIYTETDKKMIGRHVDSRKLFVAQNTLDSTHLKPIVEKLTQEGKEAIKSQMGFRHRYNLTFIGRLLNEKMPETVLEVFNIIHQKMPGQVGIHFVGGGDTTTLKDTVALRQWEKDVFFHGAVYDDYLSGAYLFASDMMIMPGYLGLAVNHAFIFGCPVVSFQQTEKGPFHSPEIEYVTNGETGFLIPNLSVVKMAETIMAYLNNSDLQKSMKGKIKEKIESLTPENMVKGFTDAIDYVLKNNEYSIQNPINTPDTEGVHTV